MASDTSDQIPTFFPTPSDFRSWLEKHHETEQEFWVGFHKKGSGKPSITWPEAVDQALCFGWIDGVRKSVDGESYMIRFSPRKPRSIWSAVNLKRVEELMSLGMMHPAGIRAYAIRIESNSSVYSYEQTKGVVALDPTEEQAFQAHSQAWAYFQSQPAWYRKACIWWVISPKQAATRRRRLTTLIEDSAHERQIAPLRRPTKSAE